jgi:sucrose-phosphate synthase
MSNDDLGSNIPVQIENLLTTKRLQIINLHGLFRGFDLELGVNEDTGGQTRYVLELVQALGKLGIGVDVFTRLIEDCDASYALPIEEHGNVRIVRIRCGGTLYLRKELLWPVLQECVAGIIQFNQEQGITPFAFHGHYAESGKVAADLADHYNVPLVFTGHSFGIPKKASVQSSGKDMIEAEEYFNFESRISAERQVMQQADRIICNSELEVENQVKLYGADLTSKCRPIPPGVSTAFFPFSQEETSISDSQARPIFEQFLKQPTKPFILAIARPEPKKNLVSLIKAYGRDQELQNKANLVILAGKRKNISSQGTNQVIREVITQLLLAVDKYNLWGKVALPKQHLSSQVPYLYRLAAHQKGVFINPALTEPFGLTLLEAAASGLPIVATSNGGPPEIIRNCSNGLLIDPQNIGQIATALHLVLGQRDRWEMYSRNGVQGVERHYSWNTHCRRYLELLSGLIRE